MSLRTGVDLMEIYRISAAIERQGDPFLKRIFTQNELDQFGSNIASLAARFAAKEAVSKALGTGFGGIGWTEVEILRGPAGEPVLRLYGNAQRLAETLGIIEWSISISHTREHAVAMVVARDQSPDFPINN